MGELKDKKIICEEFVKIFGLKKIACIPERKKCSWINCLCSGAERLQLKKIACVPERKDCNGSFPER